MSIIILNRKIIEPSRELVVCNEVSGQFIATLWNPQHGVKMRVATPNLVLNGGLDRLATWSSSSDAINHCQIGTSSTAVVATQSALSSWLANSDTLQGAPVNTYVAGPPDYLQRIKTFRFAAGVGTGNLAEVGVGWGSSGSTLFSRALFLDGVGSPIVIPKTSIDILDISYVLRVYPMAADVTGSITISGTSYDYTIRAATVSNTTGPHSAEAYAYGYAFNQDTQYGRMVSYTTDLVARTASIYDGIDSAAANVSASPSRSTYGAGNFYRDTTGVFGIDKANGNIKRVCFGGVWYYSAYQCAFASPIVKDNTQSLSLTFRQSWARRP